MIIMANCITISPSSTMLNFPRIINVIPAAPVGSRPRRFFKLLLHCAPLNQLHQQQEQEQEVLTHTQTGAAPSSLISWASSHAPPDWVISLASYSALLVEFKVDAGIMCEPCNGKGWLLCDFCKGQKTNVKADNKRIYRRCPSCRAVGYLLCSKCKVFKCVTFPNSSDGEELTF